MRTPARFAELDDMGLSASQIARECGVSARTVVRWRHAAGRSRGAQADPVSEALLSRARLLLDDGASASEAARTIGCSTKALLKRWPNSGWTPQQSGAFALDLRRLRVASELRGVPSGN